MDGRCRGLELRRRFKSLFDSSVGGNISRVPAAHVHDWLVSARLMRFEPALHFYCATFCSRAHFWKTSRCYICPRVATLIFAVIFFTALHISFSFLFSTPGPSTRHHTQEQPVWTPDYPCSWTWPPPHVTLPLQVYWRSCKGRTITSFTARHGWGSQLWTDARED